MSPRASFANSVFLNCPFDDAYQPIFQAIVFAIYDCGWVPRCALEESDSGDVRFGKIHRLLKKCRYSIHDVSRTTLDPDTNLPRFNMPLELGVELGLQNSGIRQFTTKRCLVLETELYRYRKFISDIAGQDIKAHNDSPQEAIRQVRNWLKTTSRRRNIPGGTMIARRYGTFLTELPKRAAKMNLEVNEMVYLDYTKCIEEWLEENAPVGSPPGAGTTALVV